MKILVNNKETDVVLQSSIEILLSYLQLPEIGIAIAVNNKIVPRIEWNSFHLKENDRVVIIKAACGG